MGCTLIICEKPDAASHLAEALGSDGTKKVQRNGVPYYELYKGGNKILVCSALGHLYQVDSKDSIGRRHWPVWDVVWKPKHLVEKGQKRTEVWLRSIGEIAKEADQFVNACDYDIEGSLIGYTILKYACGADRKAKRMKFSTLTEKELRSAYDHLMPQLDYPLVNAGMCRHEVDWLYGINLSRSLTESAHVYSGKYATISTGRVQGPTLKFVVDREVEILTHVPLPYWTIETLVILKGADVPVEYELDKIEVRAQADKVVQECDGRTGQVQDLDARNMRLAPPTPFDLTTLQGDAYRHFGFTPSQSLGLAERLYLDALISYPRTSSQKLPDSIGYAEIVGGLAKYSKYEVLAQKLLSSKKLSPNEGKKDDPAHPAIFPTGNPPKRKLEPREEKLLDLVVRRFMATFGPEAVKQSSKATLAVQGHKFYLRGSRILEPGWIEYYRPYANFEEIALPQISVGEEFRMKWISAKEKYTQPPPRFNPSSLLRLMEDENIGTKATRAEITETLYKRKYLKGERIGATPLAFDVIGLLERYCPKVIDVGFTRELEHKMEKIESGENDRESVVLQAVEDLKPIVEALKEHEARIGKRLSETIKGMRESEVTLISPCPDCGSNLVVIRSRKSGKRFIGCSGRWKTECRFSLPLPQFGLLTLLEKNCPDCGFQMVQVRSKGRRPMVSCPRCFVRKMKAKAQVITAEATTLATKKVK